jgi:hypothetical protein
MLEVFVLAFAIKDSVLELTAVLIIFGEFAALTIQLEAKILFE